MEVIKIKTLVNKVGSRWYQVEIFNDDHWLSREQLANIEATRHDGSSWTNYQTTWTLTGLGCRKYRDLALNELARKFSEDNKLKTEHEKWIEKWRNEDELGRYISS